MVYVIAVYTFHGSSAAYTPFTEARLRDNESQLRASGIYLTHVEP